MFGECCFNVGDVKITMGTGTFMDINTGSKPHTSVAGTAKTLFEHPADVIFGYPWQGDVLPPCRSLSSGGVEDRLRGGLPGGGECSRHGHRHQMGTAVG